MKWGKHYDYVIIGVLFPAFVFFIVVGVHRNRAVENVRPVGLDNKQSDLNAEFKRLASLAKETLGESIKAGAPILDTAYARNMVRKIGREQVARDMARQVKHELAVYDIARQIALSNIVVCKRYRDKATTREIYEASVGSIEDWKLVLGEITNREFGKYGYYGDKLYNESMHGETDRLISTAAFIHGPVIVTKVIDGDILQIKCNGVSEDVRLIGIDVPAKQYTKSLVSPGDTIRLEFDVWWRDRYGRLLVYVYLSDGRMLNELIVKAGHASVMTVQPNVKYKDLFLKAYQGARGR